MRISGAFAAGQTFNRSLLEAGLENAPAGGWNPVLVMVPAMVLGIGLALPVLTQETSGSSCTSAGTSMHRADEDTEGAAKNAFHGTVTALDDTRITTEEKTDLGAAKDLRSGQIHVTRTAGVVTLRGTVHDSAVASRAEASARNASGVRGAKNDLRVSCFIS